MTKLVFVLGAGSAKAFGNSLPVGSELAQSIEEEITQNFKGGASSSTGPIAEALRKSDSGFTDDLFRAGVRIGNGLIHHASIDDLLHEWSQDSPEMVRVGKLLISHLILKAERGSALGRTISDDLDEAAVAMRFLRSTWAGYLMQNLKRDTVFRRTPAEAFKDIAFIIFNYDRCLEQYLYWAFQIAGLSRAESATALAEIPIVHIYGRLGTLPFTSAAGRCTAFGAQTLELDEVASGIQVYTEEHQDKKRLRYAHQLLAKAKRVVFLGFGYHPTSVKLLFPHGSGTGCEFWGACQKADGDRIEKALEQFFPKGLPSVFREARRKARSQLVDMECGDFLRCHKEFLS